MAKANTRIRELLARVIGDAPRARHEIQGKLAAEGYTPDLPFSVAPAVAVSSLPTFARGVVRPLTPMLADRFEFASTIVRFYKVWLSATGMSEAMSTDEVVEMHSSIRKYWEGSPPMLYPDGRLTLFAITRSNPEDLIYLVWKDDVGEPEVWESCGMDSQSFANLEEFLEAIAPANTKA